VDAAGTGDEVLVANGVYTGVQARAGVTQVVIITKTLALRGGYTTTNWTTSDPNANPTTLDAEGQGRVVYITADVTPTVEGLYITGGDGSTGGDGNGGGIAIQEATAIIRNNVISDNVGSRLLSVGGDGGGIYVITTTSPVLIYSNTIQANVGYSGVLTSSIVAGGGLGGGIATGAASSAIITGNQILSNTAAQTDIPSSAARGYGGGIGSVFAHALTIEDNTIQGNLGVASGLRGFGGGIVSFWTPVVTITDNAIVDNTGIISGSDASGGGIYLGVFSDSGQRFTLTGNWVISNTAGITITPNATFGMPNPFAGGGGIRIWGGGADNDILTLEKNHLLYNVSAVYAADLNTGTVEGGGLSVGRISTTLMISNEISHNTAARRASTSGAGGWGGGVVGGGLHFWESDDITIQDSRIENNVAVEEMSADGMSSSSDAGGLSLQSFQTAVLSDNWIVGNVAAISASITSTTGENYSASGGGGRIDGYDTPNDSLTMENNYVINNVAARTMTTSGADSMGHAEGGGLNVTNITTTLIISNEIRGNTAVENLSLSGSGGWGGRPSGGGMYLSDNDTVTLSGSEVRDNVTAKQQVVNGVSSNSEGGGIVLENVENANVTSNTISANVAVITGSITSDTGEDYYTNGGGIMVGCWDKPSCNLSLADNHILTNTTAYTITVSGSNARGMAHGGGIELHRNVSANLQKNTVSGNVAHQEAGPSDDAVGGGMDVNGGTVTMSQNRFLGNRSSQGGWGTPAFWVWEGSLTSINDVFAHNAGGVGAAAGGYDRSFSDVTIINDTFYDNGRVGVEANMTSTVYVTNTIVYSHDRGLSLNDPASTLIGDYNLLSNTVNYAGGVAPGTNDITDEDPLFLDAPNDDFHIASNSPAVDTGTDAGAPSVDFEGDTRPQGSGVDIGADEAAGQDIYLPIIMKNY